MSSYYICMHMYVIINTVNQNLLLMNYYFLLPSENDSKSPKAFFNNLIHKKNPW